MLNLIMDLRWMILSVFLVCAEVENVTQVKVELGQNITLNCSQNFSNIYWNMEIHSGLHGCIGRTYTTSDTDPIYCSESLKTKYFLKAKSLVIRNITAEDCRLYFCGRRVNGSTVYVDTFRLVSDVPPTPSTNHSEAKHQQELHDWTIWQSEPFIYSSLSLNVFLIITVIGLLCTSHHLRRNNINLNNPSPPIYTNNLEIPQYEEIQLSRIPPPATECIYYKAQLPHSALPQR